MAVLTALTTSWPELAVKLLGTCTVLLTLAIVWNVLRQIFFKNAREPPVVFHWVPIIGSTITYGMDPFKFFLENQKKYGDIYTFVLLGKKTTVYLGPKGNQFILNAKHNDANAEDVYAVLTTPVFGSDVIYDCPNSKFMEQKKFIKFGLHTEAVRSYVPLMEKEVRSFLKQSPEFGPQSGIVDIHKVMGQITLFTAARTLQGAEIREKLDSTFAQLFHDLDDGFTPLNFMLPWAPLPQNKRRDAANRKMTQIYADIIRDRKQNPGEDDNKDMIGVLMNSTYKDGTPVPDHEIAHLMLGLLLAGQHSSSSSSAWTMLRLASQPDITEELYQEQVRVLGDKLENLTLEDIHKLTLHHNTVREILRLHPPIHSIMRKATNNLPIPEKGWVVPAGHTLLAAPGTMSYNPEYFPDPEKWNPHRWDTIKDAEDNEKEKVDYGFGLVSTGASSTYLPFGAGRHRCIGENFAYLQLTLIIAIMVQEFKFKNMPGQIGVVETDYSSMFSRPKWPANIQYERRTKV